MTIGSVNNSAIPLARQAVFDIPELGTWYTPVILGPGTIGNLAANPTCLRQAVEIIERLESDDYVRYLQTYYRTGLERFGEAWRYADIVTVLLATAKLLRPERYLEIGVRRGRSMAMVAASCPDCEIVGIDMWVMDYANMPNPGPEFVRSELEKFNYTGHLELIRGNSHEILPRYFKEHPDVYFDLVTIDGDHSPKGARQDLRDVLPRLKVGGVLVFDDICHPSHPQLADVWAQTVEANSKFACWHYNELGYGVALAVRKEV